MMEEWRKDFPVMENLGSVYLDNAATTQKPYCVIERLEGQYRVCNANVHRSPHRAGREVTKAYEDARKKIASFWGADERWTTIFTSGATEGINLVAYAFSEAFCKPGDRIIVFASEHHSNFVPWQQRCLRLGLEFSVVMPAADGTLDMDAFGRMLDGRTKLVAVAHMTNVFGNINPVEEIITAAHRMGAAVLVDGAQAAAHLPLTISGLDCDFYSLSGHKVYGPNGIGVLFGRKSIMEKMGGFHFGGEMIEDVDLAQTTFNQLPYKFEAGTPNYTGAIGFGEAVGYLTLQGGIRKIEEQEEELYRYLCENVRRVKGIHFPMEPSKCRGILSFTMEGLHSLDVALLLDKLGIAVRGGSHCAHPYMKAMRLAGGTARISLGMYNTPKDIDCLVKGLHRIGNRQS